jgi:hypothetical protein
MPGLVKEYGPEVQYVTKDTPLNDILYLIKRDGAVFVRNLVDEKDVDRAYDDVRERLETDPEWNGSFYPGEQPLFRDSDTVWITIKPSLTIAPVRKHSASSSHDRQKRSLHENPADESTLSSHL